MVPKTPSAWVAALTVGDAGAGAATVGAAVGAAAGVGYALADMADAAGFVGDGTSAYRGITGIATRLVDGTHTTGTATAGSGHDTFAELDAADLASLMAALPERWWGTAKFCCSAYAAAQTFMRLGAVAGGPTAWSIIPIAASSMSRSNTASGSPRRASSPRSARNGGRQDDKLFLSELLSSAIQSVIRKPYLLFLGDAQDQLAAKTAAGVAHWRPEWCVGQFRLPGCRADLGLDDITLDHGMQLGAATLVIGVANRGGIVPAHWIDEILQALDYGYDIANGLHQRLRIFQRLHMPRIPKVDCSLMFVTQVAPFKLGRARNARVVAC